jgi:uncharacterized RDD family membrane protein YckC
MQPAALPIATRYPGVGPRAAATVVDWIVGFVVVGVPVLLLFGHHTTTHDNGSYRTEWSTNSSSVGLLWLVLAVAYYVVFEGALGTTPGKFPLGLRVRMADGTPCTWRAALVRNVLRVVDMFPYLIPYLVGAIVIWDDDSEPGEAGPRRRRRLGDRAAGTLVVHR